MGRVPLAGDSWRVVPTSVAATLASLRSTPRVNARARMVVLYAPDGNDGTNGPAANTDVVWVGPNKSANFPLGPGATVTYWNINPWDIGVSSPSTGQLLFASFGGDDPPEE